MGESTLSDKELMAAQCYDLSIQTLPNGKDFLILICKDKEGSDKLLEIFHQNAFDMTVLINEKTGNYSLNFQFIDSDLAFRFDTGKNETTYPPLKKLKNNGIKFITTGIWTGRSRQGRICEYSPNFFRFGLFDPAISFNRATEVQFISGKSAQEPSIVLLVFKDHDQIFETEADEAYNRLVAKIKSRPHLEIAPKGSEKINLRIWDTLIDLDIPLEGLNYSENQLKEFLEKNDPNHSFAFALGIISSDPRTIAIVATKQEGFEFLTFYGYNLRTVK